MPDYPKIKEKCQSLNQLSSQVIDDFLIPYAAHYGRLEKKVDRWLNRFKHVFRELPKAYYGLCKSQLLAYEIFKENGWIHAGLKREEIKELAEEEREFLVRHSQAPWHFSFCRTLSNPTGDFYDMQDIFTGEEFLLYSPGMTRTKADHNGGQDISLWFHLLSNNGDCYQSFGPIGYYHSLFPDDIFFFATELDFRIDSDEELLKNLAKNPTPYLMLISGAELRRVFHKKDEILSLIAYVEVPKDFDLTELKGDFISEKSGFRYQFLLKEYDGFPHYVRFYLNRKTGEGEVAAMTDVGYETIRQKLGRLGIGAPEWADIQVRPSALNLFKNILQKSSVLLENEAYFTKKGTSQQQEKRDDINLVLEALIPHINKGTEPDYHQLAKNSDLSIEDLKELTMALREKIDRATK